ncbi:MULTISPECIES: hypothetical protein [unclassified Bacillus (in: firmicutes)]|uniref:hypothetical protein n=1 Tax=unclassified Bacillus (in: firmicutes) TaxID=185979 RepID=UPI001BE6C7EC|nr:MULTISPECIES: hypothetical protein [unclassified Bacillus (in: firmicutes)]MBT2614113.1 hypothetical protein [Bacillus sp. ISL-78]MBT2629376.1 hypothetical protein [Bacillus sp. ISL-101]
MEEMDMPQRLENHEQRISQLETNYGEVIKEISVIKQGQDQIEKTVLQTSNSQKDILVSQNQTMLQHLLTINQKQEEVKGQVQLTKIAAEKDVTVAKMSSQEKILVALLSAPGLLLAAFEYIPKIISSFGG